MHPETPFKACADWCILQLHGEHQWLRAGLYVYEPREYEEKGIPGAELADKDLKAVLEGLAKHLFGDVEVSLSCHPRAYHLLPQESYLPTLVLTRNDIAVHYC